MVNSQDALIQSFTMDLDGFLHRLGDLTQAAWGPDWGRIMEAEPVGTDPASMDAPIITFQLIRRVPSVSKPGMKPRMFEQEPDPEYPGYSIEIHRQWNDCEVEFLMWHTSHAGAKDLTKRMEHLLLAFAGYFKDLGVSEIIWLREESPNLGNASGTGLPCRSLTYMIRLERVLIIRRKNVENIAVQVLAKGAGHPDGTIVTTVAADPSG